MVLDTGEHPHYRLTESFQSNRFLTDLFACMRFQFPFIFTPPATGVRRAIGFHFEDCHVHGVPMGFDSDAEITRIWMAQMSELTLSFKHPPLSIFDFLLITRTKLIPQGDNQPNYEPDH
jgi:hypothetical protein